MSGSDWIQAGDHGIRWFFTHFYNSSPTCMPSTLLLNPIINITLPLDSGSNPPTLSPSFQFSCNNCKSRVVAYLYIYIYLYMYIWYTCWSNRESYTPWRWTNTRWWRIWELGISVWQDCWGTRTPRSSSPLNTSSVARGWVCRAFLFVSREKMRKISITNLIFVYLLNVWCCWFQRVEH